MGYMENVCACLMPCLQVDFPTKERVIVHECEWKNDFDTNGVISWLGEFITKK